MTGGYTRGPWGYGWETSAREWAIITNSAGNIIANVNTETGPDAQSVPATRKMPAEANARLIAAAPELLEALKATLEEIERVEADVEYKLPCGDKARAAIARAEGSAE